MFSAFPESSQKLLRRRAIEGSPGLVSRCPGSLPENPSQTGSLPCRLSSPSIWLGLSACSLLLLIWLSPGFCHTLVLETDKERLTLNAAHSHAQLLMRSPSPVLSMGSLVWKLGTGSWGPVPSLLAQACGPEKRQLVARVPGENKALP